MPLPDSLQTVTADAGTTPELSVVMPCFNESEVIESVLRGWIAELDAKIEAWEIIVINDGSTDGTARVLDRLRKDHRHLRVIHQLNTGQDGAARRGYELSRGAFVLLTNSDGRVHPEDFALLWERRHSGNLVLGKRTLPPNRWLRRAGMRALGRVVRFLFGVRLEDAESPFRLMRREPLLGALAALPAGYRAVNLALSIRLAKEAPGAVLEIPVPSRLRPAGARPPQGSVVRRALACLGDLLRLRFVTPEAAALPSGKLHVPGNVS